MNLLIIISLIHVINALDWEVNNQEQKKDYLIVTSNVDIIQAEQNVQQGQYQRNQDQFEFGEEIKKKLLEEFNSYDLDEDGILLIDELRQSFHGEAQQQVRELFGLGDTDMNGHLSFSEFFKFRTRDSFSDL